MTSHTNDPSDPSQTNLVMASCLKMRRQYLLEGELVTVVAVASISALGALSAVAEADWQPLSA
jgi:hypothetical protein